jgi:putative transposase
VRPRKEQTAPARQKRERAWHRSQSYPSDLTDEQWALLEPLIPPAKSGGRPRSVDMREVLNAIFYVDRTGCQWRALPHDFAPWSTVWTYFRTWRNDGTWERIHTALREQRRVKQGREPTPSAAIIESQSVKTSQKGGFAATTAASRSKEALVISWWIPTACSCTSWCMRPVFRTTRVAKTCSHRSESAFRASS